MENQYRVGQLTKELVAAELRNAPDPCLITAQTIAKTLTVTLKAIANGESAGSIAIEEAVRGGLQGLLLADLDVAKAGLMTLREMATLAHDLGRDPMEMLLSAMRGMASLKRLIPPEQMNRLRQAIDSEFDGAGEAFSRLLDQVPDPASRANPCRPAS